MNRERKDGILIAWLVALMLALMTVGYGFGLKEGEKRSLTDFPVKADTLIVRDTIVETKPVFVAKTRVETVTDTLTVILHDTVRIDAPVEVPITYARADYDNATVWHHGYRSVIDSLQVYPETVYITKETERRADSPSRWSLGVSGGYGVGKDGLTPYVGVGLTYELVRLPRIRRRERIDWE